MTKLKQRRAEMYQLAMNVLGSEENAEGWMHKPALGLNGQIPAELIRTTNGAKQVEKLLMQIEHGIYV